MWAYSYSSIDYRAPARNTGLVREFLFLYLKEGGEEEEEREGEREGEKRER